MPKKPTPGIRLAAILLAGSALAAATAEEGRPEEKDLPLAARFETVLRPVPELDGYAKYALAVPDRLSRTVKQMKERDPDAEFTFFRGFVDSFSTSAKPIVPAYAREALAQYNLAPAGERSGLMEVTNAKIPSIDYDRELDLILPYVPEEAFPALLPNRTLRRVPEEVRPRVVTPRRLPDGVLREVPEIREVPTDRVSPDLRARTQEEGLDRPGRGKDEGRQIPVQRTEMNPLLRAEQSSFKAPSEEILKAERAAAPWVLSNFLEAYGDVFEIGDPREMLENYEIVDFKHARHSKRLVMEQRAGRTAIQSSRTIVQFDHNWNVINVSRMLLTPEKMKAVSRPGNIRDRDIDDKEIAAMAVDLVSGRLDASKRTLRAVTIARGFDLVRGYETVIVRVAGAAAAGVDLSLTFDGRDGALLNVSDNIDRETDAKVNYWGFTNGDYDRPVRYVASNFYTRDNNTLVHDFFHLVTDNRNNGDPLHTCTSTPQNTRAETAAYNTRNGSNYMRPTRRNDRDFSLWWPSENSGTFGEANTYYWARWYVQWQKSALKDYGALPSSASNYDRVLIIQNSCNDGVGVHNSSLDITTLNNVGEGTNVIRLPERCRAGFAGCSSPDYADSNTWDAYIFAENAGYSSPGVIHHELNHFLLKRYLDVGSSKDCAAGTEMKFLHEGALGRSLPQAYWHSRYGVGYAPTPTSRQYRAGQTSGRPHTNNSSLNTLSDFACTEDVSSYSAGSVVHQAMYKFFHGISVSGATQSSIPRFSTSRDFVLAYYWAADLTQGASVKSRERFARELMWIMENHSNLSSGGKGEWCDVFDTHELDDLIPNSYCS